MFETPGTIGAPRDVATVAGEMVQLPTTATSSSGDDEADQRADRQILQESLFQFGEIDVEHHHHEEEQDGDGADIDDDEDHRQEFRAHQQEQPGRTDEGEDQEEHGMDGVSGRRSP